MNIPRRFLFAALLATSAADAALIGGVDQIPAGAFYADAVSQFNQGPGPAAAFSDPNNSLGAPNVNTTNGLACFSAPTTANCLFTSLGNGGSLTLQLANFANGSSATATPDGIFDLFVVEVGVAEATGVEISANLTDWINVGSIAGGSGNSVGVFVYGFDVDAAGIGTADLFRYVRLTDVVTDVDTSPQGADIDAIAGIRTAAVPGPATLPLAATAVGFLLLRRWFRPVPSRRPG